MASGFLAGGADAELRAAIATVEAQSCAEVVIAVRRRSARWLHAHLAVGALAAFAALGFMLWDEHVFSLASIWIDPFVLGGVTGAAVHWLPMVQRALTPRRARRREVRRAARVAFHERGVRRTRGRTGILVYVSLLERMADVVADDAVLRAAPTDSWRQAIHAIDHAVARGGKATAAAIAALGPLLGPCLPLAADDLNELPDELDDRDDEPDLGEDE
jgi:putative membrane protein